MSDYILFYAPGTCARVPMTCLEEAGVSFESRVVSFTAKEQRDTDYLKLNPAGKVPVLVEDGRALVPIAKPRQVHGLLGLERYRNHHRVVDQVLERLAVELEM